MTRNATFKVNGINAPQPVRLQELERTTYDDMWVQELKASDEQLPLKRPTMLSRRELPATPDNDAVLPRRRCDAVYPPQSRNPFEMRREGGTNSIGATHPRRGGPPPSSRWR